MYRIDVSLQKRYALLKNINICFTITFRSRNSTFDKHNRTHLRYVEKNWIDPDLERGLRRDVPLPGSPGPTTRPQNIRTESSTQIYQYQPAMELPNIPFSKSEYIETVSYVCSTLTKITSIIFLQKLLGKKSEYVSGVDK